MVAVGMTYIVTLQPSQQLDFKKPNEWVKWICRFQQFMSISELDKEDDLKNKHPVVLSRQRGGKSAQKKYAEVLAKLDKYFKVYKMSLIIY